MGVLLIGGDGEILRMTGKILARQGYRIQTAIGPGEAEAALRKGPFRLVLLDRDVGSPDLNSLIRSVKDLPGPPPLLVLSGSREDEVPSLTAGADDWIQKPYQMDVLLARMAALLR